VYISAYFDRIGLVNHTLEEIKMHTVLRHTATKSGFAVVISGRGSENTVVQEYDTYAVNGPAVYTTLVSEHSFSDERDAITHFEWIYFSNEV